MGLGLEQREKFEKLKIWFSNYIELRNKTSYEISSLGGSGPL